VPNGFGEYNRKHTRSGIAEDLGIVCWNSCLNCEGGSADVVELNAGALVVYPNPFSDYFVVEVEAVSPNASLELMDMTGRVVMVNNLNGLTTQRIELNTSSLAQGMYSLRLVAAGRRTVSTVVKY